MHWMNDMPSMKANTKNFLIRFHSLSFRWQRRCVYDTKEPRKNEPNKLEAEQNEQKCDASECATNIHVGYMPECMNIDKRIPGITACEWKKRIYNKNVIESYHPMVFCYYAYIVMLCAVDNSHAVVLHMFLFVVEKYIFIEFWQHDNIAHFYLFIPRRTRGEGPAPSSKSVVTLLCTGILSARGILLRPRQNSRANNFRNCISEK